MSIGRSSVLAGFLALATSASALAQGGSQLSAPDYAKMADGFAQSHGAAALARDPASIDPLLAQAYVALDVGLFDVRMPVRFLDTEPRLEEYLQVVGALLDLQARYAAWIGEVGADGKPAKFVEPPSVGAMRRFLKGLKLQQLQKGLKTASGSMLKAGAADDATVKAVEEVALWIRERRFLGAPQPPLTPVRVVLAPSREEFVGLLSWIGSLSEANKKVWQPTLALRTEQHVNDLLVLALEYASPTRTEKEPWLGIGMNTREKTGLVELVTEYGTEYLLRSVCGRTLPPWLEDGLCVEIVVQLYGEDNSRVHGSGEANSTPARSKFVRGGQSQGGKLAQISADNSWRVDKGHDHFVQALRQAQKDAPKEADKQKLKLNGTTTSFALNAEIAPDKACIVTAPFLGAIADSKQIPEVAKGDYAEFQRAYRCCFTFWMSKEAKPKSDTAAVDFARLLRACASPQEESALEKDVEAAYGMPLTSAEAGPDTLEGRFLAWLASHQ